MSSSSANRSSAPAAPRQGEVVGGKYRIEERLGAGGMGVVVRATHLQLGEPVALKFLQGELMQDVGQVRRFLREARAAVRIKSEHVARVLDAGTLPGGEPFMVMELLDGEDLHRLSRRRGPLPLLETVAYVVQACAAIAEAHQLGIVHRDLKPANLFLTRRADGSPLVKVLDFGIAKSAETADAGLTVTGETVGSPHYMSPEQIRDARFVDGRSDIWALGAILYTLLAGHPPFFAPSSSGTLAKIVADPVPPLSQARPDVPAELEAIVLCCLEKKPERRFQRVEDLVGALSSWQERALATPSAAGRAAAPAPPFVPAGGPAPPTGPSQPSVSISFVSAALLETPRSTPGSIGGASPSVASVATPHPVGAASVLTPHPVGAASLPAPQATYEGPTNLLPLPAETTATASSVTGRSRPPRSALVLPAALAALLTLVVAVGLVLALGARQRGAAEGSAAAPAPPPSSSSAPSPSSPPPRALPQGGAAGSPTPQPPSGPPAPAVQAPAPPSTSAARPSHAAPAGREPRHAAAPPARSAAPTVPIYGQD